MAAWTETESPVATPPDRMGFGRIGHCSIKVRSAILEELSNGHRRVVK